MLLHRAKKGARGKAQTKMVMNPYWRQQMMMIDHLDMPQITCMIISRYS